MAPDLGKQMKHSVKTQRQNYQQGLSDARVSQISRTIRERLTGKATVTITREPSLPPSTSTSTSTPSEDIGPEDDPVLLHRSHPQWADSSLDSPARANLIRMAPEEDSPLVQRIKKRKLILSSDSEEGEAPFFTSDATPEIFQSSPSPTRQFAFFSPLTAPSPSSAPTQPPSPSPCSSSAPTSQFLDPTLRRAVTQKASPVFDGHKVSGRKRMSMEEEDIVRQYFGDFLNGKYPIFAKNVSLHKKQTWFFGHHLQ
ncbi:hypothetical protein LOTGIDRAFT_175125 [Lottia gigantea]|uniref:Uncharacterized protein n=1 Tax=Lottia gigantea TaxID=225164 RepID=V4AFD8_LOTGI|nr:hypothetical protein LOTGIDRAFT_175125 [Lottia gigantea]ESO95592.1 hypothetical protein LOTGIDRAFT_175125 [Lottia gigantea]